MAKDGAKEPTKTDAPAASGRTVYTFSEPVTWKGETLTEVSYRRATGRDLRKWYNKTGYGDRVVGMLVDITDMPEAFFDALPAGDWFALSTIVDGFFVRPQATSEA